MFNGAKVCLMLERRLGSSEYLLALHIVSDNFDSQEITVDWITTVEWKSQSRNKQWLERRRSHTFTEDGGKGVFIDPMPSSRAILDISVKITSWIVREKPYRKRGRSPEYSNSQTKFARITSDDEFYQSYGYQDSSDSDDHPYEQSYSPNY